MIGRGNLSSRRKSAPVTQYPPQIPHDLTQARTLAAAIGLASLIGVEFLNKLIDWQLLKDWLSNTYTLLVAWRKNVPNAAMIRDSAWRHASFVWCIGSESWQHVLSARLFACIDSRSNVRIFIQFYIWKCY
jgi:hypothetical protein